MEFFHSEAQSEEIADAVMVDLENWLMTNPQGIEHDTAYTKAFIRNSIRRSSSSRKLQFVRSDQDGMNVYQVVRKNKPLKVSIDGISSPSAKQVMEYYSQEMRQVDIARKLNVSKSYISQMVKKWTI